MAGTVYGAVGVFHDEAALRAAVEELLVSGFDRADLGVLAGHRTIERRLGHDYGKVTELEDLPLLAGRPYVGPASRTVGMGVLISALMYVGAVAAAGSIMASGGTVATMILGAAAAGGGGGLVGAGLVKFMAGRHAMYLQDHLAHGGLLLWVHADNPEKEEHACAILRGHAAEDAHVHEMPEISFPTTGGVSHSLSFMNRLGL
jgi:hypothetical protein